MPRVEGGRGFKSLLAAYDESVVGVALYLCMHTEPLLNGAWRLAAWLSTERSRKTVFSEANKIVQALGFSGIEMCDVSPKLGGKQIRREDKKSICLKVTKLHRGMNSDGFATRRMASRFLSWATKMGKHSFDYVVDGKLRPAQEAVISVAQNRCLRTNAYNTHITKTSSDPTCRLCHEEDETVTHILSRCKKHSYGLFLNRHDEALWPVLHHLCKWFGLPVPQYRRRPLPIRENERAKILWDVCIPTYTELTARRPDLVWFDKA